MNITSRLYKILFMALFFAVTTDVLAQHRTQRGNDIIETAVEAGSFNTLAAALDAAGLVNTIKEANSLTVFAPTDEAFAKLPKGTVESLLKPENKDQLISILTYHVVKGRVRAQEVAGLRTAETLNGQRVSIAIEDGRIQLDESNVVAADIRASNGIIHVIDEVLIPETKKIPEIAQEARAFGTLITALQEAKLVEPLLGKGPFTVFAPTDEAFSGLPDGTVASLLKPENRQELQRILRYHVVEGRVYSDDFLRGRTYKTLAGAKVKLGFNGGVFRANDSKVTSSDIDAANGVIHIIDAVLLPETMSTASAAAFDVMMLAIEKGVPLYNHGQKSACAAIYQVAAKSVLAMEGVSEQAKKPLRLALDNIETTHNASRQAWMLREGLDSSLEILGDNTMMASR